MSDTFLTDTIHATLVARRGGDRVRTEIRAYASGVGDLLEVWELNKDGEAEPSGCQRKVYLPFFPEHVTPTATAPAQLLNFAVGDAYHATIESLLAEAGVLVAAEIPLKEYHQHMSGRLDWLIRHPTRGLCIADGKSEASWSFKNKPKPKRADVGQIHAYFDGARQWCMREGIALTPDDLQWGVALYFDKSSGILNEKWFRRDAEIEAAVNAEAETFVAKVTADKALGIFAPPPIPQGVKRTDWPCEFGREKIRCRFYGFCWPEKARAQSDDKPLKLRG